ncbi:hypothetical protein Verru16b_02152 [Lacunisphaera limnophila]|uniref:Uncharacterized protein n=1 Tax=Lacunisphaera limnophila TaxID=1838286 RepID=A0A1D8AW32_9BACT|nr:hypothetical protein [Lacunisphaera limnophila]AOS45076.1 hypothetical protein Verru16b_02152 [Lacunisphaera limnophila]
MRNLLKPNRKNFYLPDLESPIRLSPAAVVSIRQNFPGTKDAATGNGLALARVTGNSWGLPMAEPTPKAILSSKCIAYSEALLQYRRSVMTDQQAIQQGRDLFVWLQGRGALANDERAAVAGRCIDLGITLLKAGAETVDRITASIQDTYVSYA